MPDATRTEIERRPNGELGWLTLENGASLEYVGATDNGGETFDRYTAGFEMFAAGVDKENDVPYQFVLTIGPTGNSPRGVCMSMDGCLDDEAQVAWSDLPAPVQAAIENEFALFKSSEAYQK